MSLIRRFEEIEGWRKARELSKMIYSITQKSDFQRDKNLSEQMRSASISIMANISEGFSRKAHGEYGKNGNREFSHFLSYSLGSISEVQSHLYVCLDNEYITPGEFEKLYSLSEEVFRLLFGLKKHLDNREETDRL